MDAAEQCRWQHFVTETTTNDPNSAKNMRLDNCNLRKTSVENNDATQKQNKTELPRSDVQERQRFATRNTVRTPGLFEIFTTSRQTTPEPLPLNMRWQRLLLKERVPTSANSFVRYKARSSILFQKAQSPTKNSRLTLRFKRPCACKK